MIQFSTETTVDSAMKIEKPVKPTVTAHKTPQIGFLEYFFVFVLLVYAAHAIRQVASTSVLENPFWVMIPVILSTILALKWKIVLNKQIYLLVLGFFIYFFAISVKFNEVRPTYFINYLLLFFTVYVAIKALNINFFRLYETVMYLLAIIGLLFWGIQIVLGGDTLFNYFGMIPGIDTWSYVSGGGYSALIYSVQPTSMSIQYDFLPPRNCGFAWEPGGFAVFLALALFINLFFFSPDKNSRIRFWVLTGALVSSQSTTGYLIFILILLFFYYNKKQKIVILIWPAVIALIIAAFTLPFMSDKIVSLYREAEMIDIMVENSIGRESSIAPQRFASFMIAFRDFLAHPILGLGGNAEASWTVRAGANVSTITGLGNLLAQHGLVGFIFFIVASYQSSAFYARTFSFKGRFLFLAMILFVSVSYGIILLPLLMIFWMFALFTPLGLDQSDIRIKGVCLRKQG
ncbi:MAG: hypothetical protein BWX96_02716 [Bacteroidetes bacterium ADurb.Bin145]|nr:MAG: hypothetical protein BWX96_02716 [Bacteroidetes bacterium ADurb.Bin145]